MHHPPLARVSSTTKRPKPEDDDVLEGANKWVEFYNKCDASAPLSNARGENITLIHLSTSSPCSTRERRTRARAPCAPWRVWTSRPCVHSRWRCARGSRSCARAYVSSREACNQSIFHRPRRPTPRADGAVPCLEGTRTRSARQPPHEWLRGRRKTSPRRVSWTSEARRRRRTWKTQT